MNNGLPTICYALCDHGNCFCPQENFLLSSTIDVPHIAIDSESGSSPRLSRVRSSAFETRGGIPLGIVVRMREEIERREYLNTAAQGLAIGLVSGVVFLSFILFLLSH